MLRDSSMKTHYNHKYSIRKIMEIMYKYMKSIDSLVSIHKKYTTCKLFTLQYYSIQNILQNYHSVLAAQYAKFTLDRILLFKQNDVVHIGQMQETNVCYS